MLRSLAFARFSIVLFPCKLGPLPFLEDVPYKVGTEGGVKFRCTFLV